MDSPKFLRQALVTLGIAGALTLGLWRLLTPRPVHEVLDVDPGNFRVVWNGATSFSFLDYRSITIYEGGESDYSNFIRQVRGRKPWWGDRSDKAGYAQIAFGDKSLFPPYETGARYGDFRMIGRSGNPEACRFVKTTSDGRVQLYLVRY